MLTPDEARVGLQDTIEAELRRAETDIDNMLSRGEREYMPSFHLSARCQAAVIEGIITAYKAVGWNVKRGVTNVLWFSEKKDK
jgi:hypothetical protein